MSEVAFAHDCAGSCACSDPSWDSQGDKIMLLPPEPEALEAGTTEHIQKKADSLYFISLQTAFLKHPYKILLGVERIRNSAVSLTDKIGSVYSEQKGKL